MPFSQLPVNYAGQYAQALANAYPYLSYFSDLWNGPNNTLYRLGRGKTIYVPSMTVSGAKAANRDQITGVFNRNWNNEWQPLTMRMDRDWDTLVDPLDIMETDEVATIANITRTFNETQKVPEMDAYAASSLAGYADEFGGSDATVYTADNILTEWDQALAYMSSQRVNRDRVVCKVTPETYILLKQAAGITRFIQITDGIQHADRNIARLDGVYITEVPPDVMKSAYDFTDGWIAAPGATQINMILYDARGLLAPIVYDQALMSAPNAQSKGKWLYYERYYYDVFQLANRRSSIFVNKSTAGTLGTVTVTSAAGSGSGATVITYSGDLIFPGGTANAGVDVFYNINTGSGQTLNYGQALPSATWTQTGANPLALTGQTAGQYVTIALVNHQTGLVVAGGNAVIVTGD